MSNPLHSSMPSLKWEKKSPQRLASGSSGSALAADGKRADDGDGAKLKIDSTLKFHIRISKSTFSDLVDDKEDKGVSSDEVVKKDNGCIQGLTVGGTLADIPFDAATDQNIPFDQAISSVVQMLQVDTYMTSTLCTDPYATEDVDGQGDRTYSYSAACVQADEDKSDTPAQQQKQVSDAMSSKATLTKYHVIETIHQLVPLEVEDMTQEAVTEDKHKPAGPEEKCTEPQGVGFTIEGYREVVNSEKDKGFAEKAKKLTMPQVIELSDDDDDDNQKSVDLPSQQQLRDELESKLWY